MIHTLTIIESINNNLLICYILNSYSGRILTESEFIVEIIFSISVFVVEIVQTFFIFINPFTHRFAWIILIQNVN